MPRDRGRLRFPRAPGPACWEIDTKRGAAFAVIGESTQFCNAKDPKGAYLMPEAGAVKDAVRIEAEAVEGVDAAQAEQQRGEPRVSIGLLIEAVEKEKQSLDVLEESLDAIRVSLEDRRRALDKQQELLGDLVRSCEKGGNDATRR